MTKFHLIAEFSKKVASKVGQHCAYQLSKSINRPITSEEIDYAVKTAKHVLEKTAEANRQCDAPTNPWGAFLLPFGWIFSAMIYNNNPNLKF